MRFFATVPFAMERPVKNELERMNISVTEVGEGRVYFDTDKQGLAKALVNLRSGDRIFWEITSFEAVSFDELFDGITKVDWAGIIAPNGKINVSAKCAKSALMSLSDVQRIGKMAIIRSMQRKIKKDKLPENGNEYPIEIHINKNIVSVALDCAGVSLHKRGYRVKNAVAPLRETFASGLIELSGFRGNCGFCDPFCGSGTLVIESALKALNIAPNAKRNFVCEKFKGFDKKIFDEARINAENAIIDKPIEIFGSDIDPDMVEMTRFHAQRAGVDKVINVSVCRALNSVPQTDRGIMITNPPYGERIGDEKYMIDLCGEIKVLLDNYKNWNCFMLSGYKKFERTVGKKAQKTRRFYNGNIECNFYNFFQKN